MLTGLLNAINGSIVYPATTCALYLLGYGDHRTSHSFSPLVAYPAMRFWLDRCPTEHAEEDRPEPQTAFTAIMDNALGTIRCVLTERQPLTVCAGCAYGVPAMTSPKMSSTFKRICRINSMYNATQPTLQDCYGVRRLHDET